MKIFIGNIHPEVEEYKLSQIFEEFGTVESLFIKRNCYSNRGSNIGFVEMPDDDAMEAIKNLNETVFHENKLEVCKSKK
ncbi:MAG: RNA-binding protein [Bacteroidales bacterium]|nr:RNA-binding protein [Bacteroidales bacterium]